MSTKALLIEKSNPPRNKEAEWNEWYSNEYIPSHLAIPGILSARRYRHVEGVPKGLALANGPRYLVLYDLAGLAILKSEPYLALKENLASASSKSFEGITRRVTQFATGAFVEIFSEPKDYSPPSSKFLFIAGHDVPHNKHKEYNAWYDTEHVPNYLRVPGFLTARRFKLARQIMPPLLGRGGTLPEYIVMYDLESKAVLDTDAFWKASVSPWSTWVRSWFTRKMLALFHQIYPLE